jgi:hypothetical protein
LIEGSLYDGADDVEEDEYLYVEGETPAEDDDGADIPVRLLSDFTVYNAGTFRVVPVAELLQLSFSEDEFQASGLVKAWVDNSDIPSDISDDDSDNGDSGEDDHREGSERVTLSKILEFSIHNKSEGVDGLDRYVLVRLTTCRDCSTSRTFQATYISEQNLHGTYWEFLRVPIDHILHLSGFSNEPFTF